DAEYGCAPFFKQTADMGGDKLMRNSLESSAVWSATCLLWNWSPPPSLSKLIWFEISIHFQLYLVRR
ncbi:hypothetical protein, partial [Chroococcidiopsis sp.]|uniref:hypothetical protein n=1 Tax=Chroococcidiopsis sp. TaxID=3088168 RepID=UPI003F2C0D3E